MNSYFINRFIIFLNRIEYESKNKMFVYLLAICVPKQTLVYFETNILETDCNIDTERVTGSIVIAKTI